MELTPDEVTSLAKSSTAERSIGTEKKKFFFRENFKHMSASAHDLLKVDVDSYVPLSANEGHIVNALKHYIKDRTLKIHGKMKMQDAMILEEAYQSAVQRPVVHPF